MQLADAFRNIDVRIKLVVLVAYFIVAFHANTPNTLTTVALIAAAAAFIAGVRVNGVVRVLAPLAFVVVVTVVMQLAYWQEGAVVAQLGPLAVTDEGVWRAVRMVVAQASVVLASVAFMQLVDPAELVDAFAWVLHPLENLGINTRGITLTLTVAIAYIPILVREFTTLRAAHEARGVSFDGPLRNRLAAYTRLFAPLVRSSVRHADNLAESLLSRAL